MSINGQRPPLISQKCENKGDPSTYRLDRLYEEVLDAERVGSKQDLLTNMENEQIETDACFGTLIRNE